MLGEKWARNSFFDNPDQADLSGLYKDNFNLFQTNFPADSPRDMLGSLGYNPFPSEITGSVGLQTLVQEVSPVAAGFLKYFHKIF